MELATGMISALLKALKESIQLQGAGLDLERPTRGDTPLHEVPELKLNICIVSEVFVQILATGLGALALVWATVVLLGGFSTSLQQADFWVITAIVFIQTARVVGINVSPEAEFFNQVPPAFLELGTEDYTRWGQRRPLTGQAIGKNLGYYLKLGLASTRDFITFMAFLAILVPAVPMIAGLGCISLSIYRLTALLSRHHDNSNVFRALILFYGLVLLQGGLFIIWLRLKLHRSYHAKSVSLHYGFEDKGELIAKYMDKTLSMAIKNGVSNTINRDLPSFAADLIKSDYSQNHIDAVLVLHTLTSQEGHRTRTLSQIQSSPLCVSRLFGMVASKSRTDQETKIRIAKIVAHLASSLRLADISGATESISSMIDPYFTLISTQATNDNTDQQTAIDITTHQQGTAQSASATNGAENIGLCISIKQLMERGSAWTKKLVEKHKANSQQRILGSSSTTGRTESKPLTIHGLLILAKLAVNPDNCKQIYDSKGLFSKIISPVKNKVYEIPREYGNGITMEITEKAIEVVSMLVSGTDETNGKIRRDICSNGIAVKDIHPILEKDHMYNKLKVPATKILTELYLDMSTRGTTGLDDIANFIKVLMKIFFGDVDKSGVRKTAGGALAELAMDNTNCTTIFDDVDKSRIKKAAGRALAELAMDNAICTTIMNFSTGTETSFVQLLTDMIPEANDYQTVIAQLLMQFCANSNSNAERERLKSVKTILHEVLKVICNIEQAANTNQAGSPQHNLGQPQAANTNQAAYPQRSPGQQQATNRTQAGSQLHKPGKQQAANANQAGSPQHSPGQPPLLPRALHRLSSILLAKGRRSSAANRNAPSDNLPAVTQFVVCRRKSLAAFLGLALQICDKLQINADDFGTALDSIPLSMGVFVDKLNDIIVQRKGHSVDFLEGKGPSDEYLIIIKTVTKLCIWMMQSKPDCITEFQNKNTSIKLQGALEDMRELELGMLLAGGAGYTANYENLSTIVATARQMMDANVQGRTR